MRRLPPQVAALVAVAALAAALTGAATAATSATAAAAGHRTPACRPSAVTARLDLANVGHGTSPAGAMIFHDVSKAACTLGGVPQVTAVTSGGSPVGLYEEKSATHHEVPAVLSPGRTGKVAAASITWSSWACAPGSYSIKVRFTGWASGLTVSSGSAAGSTTPTCSATGQTVYIGAVAPYKG